MTSDKLAKILNSIADKKDPSDHTDFLGSILCNEDVLRALIHLTEAIRNEYDLLKASDNWPDDEIFEELRLWRNNTAYVKHLRPYHICTNDTLWNIVNGHIVVKEDLLKVHGIGNYLYNNYGDDIFGILEPYIEARDNLVMNISEEAEGVLSEPIEVSNNETPTDPASYTCRKCMLYRRDDCFGRPTICEDFVLSPDFTNEEWAIMQNILGGAAHILIHGHGYNDGFDSNGRL